MSESWVEGVPVEADVLTRLIAAIRVAGCPTWSQARQQAEQDVQALQDRTGGQQRSLVQVDSQVLAQLTEAADQAADEAGHAVWARQLRADVALVAPLCRHTQSPHRPPCWPPTHYGGRA